MAGLYQYRITGCIVVFCRKYFGLLPRLANGAVYMGPVLKSQWAFYLSNDEIHSTFTPLNKVMFLSRMKFRLPDVYLKHGNNKSGQETETEVQGSFSIIQ
jgi:hypothetical protein